MDSILSSQRVLDKRSWLFFRLYKNPSASNNWQNNLDWYHQTLINVVRRVVSNNSDIAVTFFGFYGPEPYNSEEEKYERRLATPSSDVIFIRLRVSVKQGKKRCVKNAFLTSIQSNRNLVWDYETMVT